MAVGMQAASCLAVLADSRSVAVALMKGSKALETPPLDLSGSCVCMQLDPTMERLSTATSTNMVNVWELWEDSWLSLVCFQPKKRVTQLSFSQDGTTLFVSDKTGAVFAAPIPRPSTASLDQLPSTEYTQILAHLTSVSALAVDPSNRFLISADRDGKVRVSNIPEYHEIHQYCLDHKSGVSHLQLVGTDRVVAAASNGTLKVWEFTTGNCLASRDISEDLKLNWEIRGVTAMSSSYPDSNFLAVIPDGGNGVVLYQVTESDGSLKLCCSVSVPSMHAAFGVCFIPKGHVMAMLVLPVNPPVEKILGEEHTQYVAAPGVNFFSLEGGQLRAVSLEEVSVSPACTGFRMLADSLPTSPLSPDALPSSLGLSRKKRFAQLSSAFPLGNPVSSSSSSTSIDPLGDGAVEPAEKRAKPSTVEN